MIDNDEIPSAPYPDADRITALLTFATAVGATRAARLDPEAVQVENRLAAFCRSPKCPHYGQSMSCPPHVAGPAALRKILNKSLHAIVLRIEIDSDSLNGEQRPEVMRLLHEITAMVESEAKRLGFQQVQAFAGGSWKASFVPTIASARCFRAKALVVFPSRHALPCLALASTSAS